MLLPVLLALLLPGNSEAAQCACATSAVHVRSGAGTGSNVLGTLPSGDCVTYKGQTHSANGYDWANVDFHGQDGWAATNWLTISECSGSGSTGSGGTGAQFAGCPNIISRAEWGARAPSSPLSPLPGLPKYVFIHHGSSQPCHTKSDCERMVRGYQNYHMDSHHWNDIGYSFVVGEDGNVYEARGWNHIGAHTQGYNSVGVAICVIGDFNSHVPNDAALNVIKQMIQCGLDNHMISPTYHLLGHRDVGSTDCPGTKLWELIHTWPHYGK